MSEGLEFTLYYSCGTYTLTGGPLQKSFNSKEWDRFVESQGEQKEWWYRKWADEARDNEGNSVRRNLR